MSLGSFSPIMPSKFKRQTTDDIERSCDSLRELYEQSLTNLSSGDTENTLGVHGPQPNLKDSHYYRSHGEASDLLISKDTMKHIVREVTRTLPKQMDVNSRGSMFVRYDEENPQYIRACLTGVEGTPYASGVFVFDLYLPPQYPDVPLLCVHITPNAHKIMAPHGPGGFSPNMHSDSGTVCLSLLGTWDDGPGWDPTSSNVYQVLSSILWMILGAKHPYYMEPGYGGWEGDAPDYDTDPAKDEVRGYEEDIRYHTAELCILAPLNAPTPGFERVVTSHLLNKRRIILTCLRRWASSDSASAEFHSRMSDVISKIESSFNRIIPLEDAELDVAEIEEAIAFITTKMDFLHKKITLLGGEQAAAVSAPKALERWKLGPRLLNMQRQKLELAQSVLASARDRENS